MFFIIALTFLSAGRAQANSRIQYENPGARAKIVLADLSRLTGSRLLVAPETADEVLVLRCQNDPLDVVMQRIAWAVDGEWKQEPAGIRLIRSSDQQRAEETRELEAKASRYREALSKIRKQFEAIPEFNAENSTKFADEIAKRRQTKVANADANADFREFGDIQRLGPMGRAMGQFASEFDPYDLAKLPVRYRAVYSTQPTPSERPLPSDAEDIVRRFAREQSTWSAAATERGLANASSSTGIAATMRGLNENEIGKVLLTAIKYNGDAQTMLNLVIADRNGMVLRFGHEMITFEGVPLTQLAKESGAPGQPRIPVPTDMIDLSKLWTWQAKSPPSAKTLSFLTHPEAHDPLSIQAGRFLLLTARAKGISMVVDLPDSAIGFPFPQKAFVADSFLDNFGQTCERGPARDWIGYRPLAPAHNRANRANREAMGRYLRRCVEGKALSIDELATFAVELPDNYSNNTPNLLRLAVTADRKFENSDEHLMRLYGNLDDAQRAAARQGMLQLGALNDGAKQALDAYVHEPVVPLELAANLNPTPAQAAYAEAFHKGILYEPSECLPDGIPANGLLRISISSDDVARAPLHMIGNESSGELEGGQVLTPADVARERFRVSRADLFPTSPNANRPTVSRLQFGKRIEYHFKFQFTPEISLSDTLESEDFGDGNFLAYDALPESFRNQVDNEVAKLTQKYANAKPGQAGSTTQVRANPPPAQRRL
jgi:hypothetical protein